MGGPIVEVDTVALEAVARELAGLSDQLADEGTVHEKEPPVAGQPTGKATVDLTAVANHVVGECAANLLNFSELVAQAARAYDATDSGSAGALSTTMPPPE